MKQIKVVIGGFLCLSVVSVHAIEFIPASTQTVGSWSEQTLGPANYCGVTCPTRATCLAACETDEISNEGFVFRSTDGGDHWKSSGLPPDVGNLDAVACAATGVCVAVGIGGADNNTYPVMLVSTDTGSSWTRPALSVPSLSGMIGVSCPGPSVCFAVGFSNETDSHKPDAIALKTTDAGMHWTAALIPANLGLGASMKNIACPDVRHCVFGLEHGFALTTDGGRTWGIRTLQEFENEESFELGQISCPSLEQCVAVGHTRTNGFILSSTNFWGRRPV